MTPQQQDTDPIVLVEGLLKRYPGKRRKEPVTALAGVDLHVSRGEIHGLLGPNGAGKTTLIETLVGLRTPTEGSVLVLGVDPTHGRGHMRRKVAVQPQGAAVFTHQTVAELLRAWASFYHAPEDPDKIITLMGLDDSRRVRASTLSSGQRQRLLVATALISRPRLLVLDEPSTGLDPNAREELWRAVRTHRDTGGTILLSTHSMEESTALCDRLTVLDHGRVVAEGNTDQLVERYAPGAGMTEVFRTVTGHGFHEHQEAV